MRLFLCVLLAALFLSCSSSGTSSTDQDKNPSIQNIVNRWTDIEKILPETGKPPNADLIEAAPLIEATLPTETAFPTEAALLIEASGLFYSSLLEFQMSDLYRIYRAIYFLPQTERTFNNYSLRDIEEVGIVLDIALVFRDSIVQADYEKAKAVSSEISRYLIRLLVIDTEAQRYIASSYFNLLIALMFFIVIIVLLVWFLNQSLNISLKHEKEISVFSHAYMLAQDEERARISRELHDTIIQDMRCLLLETEKPILADLVRKTRDICNSLIPPDFRFSELPDAIRQLCHDFGEKSGINCRAEIDGDIKLEFLSMEKRLQIYRIVQEALTNIEKHAEAKEAIVTMRLSNGVVYIGIGDDGKGFKPPLNDSGQIIGSLDKSHIGIISMKERAAILGGRLKIVSSQAGEHETGEGTLVCLEIPGA